ncbi:MAG: hypothetical protein Q9167_006547 [Letrouitia subvulpina]
MPQHLLLNLSTSASARSQGQARRRQQPNISEEARRAQRNEARRKRTQLRKSLFSQISSQSGSFPDSIVPGLQLQSHSRKQELLDQDFVIKEVDNLFMHRQPLNAPLNSSSLDFYRRLPVSHTSLATALQAPPRSKFTKEGTSVPTNGLFTGAIEPQDG